MVHFSPSLLAAAVMGTVSIPLLTGLSSHSAVGADYRDLSALLQKRQWTAAAAETNRLIVQVADKSQQITIGTDLLTTEAVRRFPCQDLKTIDQLWRQESHDRFGFRVQLQVALQHGISVNYRQLDRSTPKGWTQFRQIVGWQAWADRGADPDVEPEPLKSKTDVPEGMFPLPVRSTGDFGDRASMGEHRAFFGSGFLERARQCKVEG